jgi:hypothetical protein
MPHSARIEKRGTGSRSDNLSCSISYTYEENSGEIMTDINTLTADVEATQCILDVKKEHHVAQDDASNIVDFDGPDDPKDPLNWSTRYKWSMVILISLLSLIV